VTPVTGFQDVSHAIDLAVHRTAPLEGAGVTEVFSSASADTFSRDHPLPRGIQLLQPSGNP